MGCLSGSLSSAELFHPSTETWTVTGRMTITRSTHTATLLPSGQVLVVGGAGDNSAELYDPRTHMWTATGRMRVVRLAHAATLLPNGQVLVAGGYGPPSGLQHSTELYTPGFSPLVRVSASSLLLDQTVGTVGASHTITLTNTGIVPLRVARLALSGAGAAAFSITTRCLHASIAPAGECPVWLRFVPVAAGRHSARLRLTDNAPNSPQSVVLTGYGTRPNTWSPADSLRSARAEHTATLLPGGRVLVVGGCCPPYVASAELFDPGTGTWSDATPVRTARSAHTATLLPSGQVLVAGGEGMGPVVVAGNGVGTSTSTALASVELYDPFSDTWRTTGQLHTARAQHTATLLPNGMVLVAGGCMESRDSGCDHALASVEVYSPTTATWSATSALQSARFGHTATLLPGGEVLLVGGQACRPGSATVLSVCHAIARTELYDPRTGTWRTTGRLHTARWAHTATLLATGQVLVAGGLTSCGGDCVHQLASAELYDPRTGRWSATGRLTVPRSNHTATLLPNGAVLVAGGQACRASPAASAALPTCSTVGSAEVYDPRSGTWTRAGRMMTSRWFHTATLLPTGAVLVVGGDHLIGGLALASAELYHPRAGI